MVSKSNIQVKKMPKSYQGVKIVSKAPKGFFRINAATAPLGFDVYAKGSLFDKKNKRQRVLVKNKWYNKFIKYI